MPDDMGVPSSASSGPSGWGYAGCQLVSISVNDVEYEFCEVQCAPLPRS